MKKLTLALACIIGMMFFASCTPEQIDEIMAQKPTVEFVSEDGFIAANTSVYVGEELNFKVKVAPNSSSKSELTHFDFSITNLNGETVFNANPEITDPNGENIFVFNYTPEAASTYAVTATITDKANKANVAAISVSTMVPTVAGIGVFEGQLQLTGHVVSDQPILGQTLDQDIDPVNFASTITLGALEEDNRVSATFNIDGTPVSVYGTKDGENIVFDEFHFTTSINVITDINLDLVVNATGVLTEDGVLTLTANADGTGTMNVLVTIGATFDGDINGTLNKVVEE